MAADNRPLPDFERPPVVEIVAAIQFAPLPTFAIADVVALGHGFDDWTVVDAPQAIPPMTETEGVHAVVQQAMFGFGTPPLRAVLSSADGRWTGQVQQDRIAVHERKIERRPSFRNVAPMLERFCEHAGRALGSKILSEGHPAEMIEVIYVNHVAPAAGTWSDFGELHRVLRVVNDRAGEVPYDRLEQAAIGFSYALTEDDEFRGRLRIAAEPSPDVDGPAFGLRVASRRFVRGADVEDILEDCHADIVRGFAAITTEEMHDYWGRYQ